MMYRESGSAVLGGGKSLNEIVRGGKVTGVRKGRADGSVSPGRNTVRIFKAA